MRKKIVIVGIAIIIFIASLTGAVHAYVEGWDTEFSGDGFAVLDDPLGIGAGSDEGFLDVYYQSDGKVVATGFAFDGGGDSDIVTVRYNADGTLDTTFDGDGIVVYDSGNGDEWGEGVWVLSSGEVLLSGFITNGAADYDAAVLKYDITGALDTSFGTNGIAIYDSGGVDDYSNGIYVLEDEVILSYGYLNNDQLAIWSYNVETGNLNTDFNSGDGTDGIAIFDDGGGVESVADLAIDDSGDLWACGQYADEMALYKFNPNGVLDTNYGTNGYYTEGAGLGGGCISVSVDDTGGSFLAGYFMTPGFPNPVRNDAIWHITESGVADVGFDGDGRLDSGDQVGAAEPWPNGKVNIFGGDYSADFGYRLWRYDNVASLDTEFDGDGILSHLDAGSGQESGYAGFVNNSGVILGAGGVYDGVDWDTDMAIWVYRSAYQVASLDAGLVAEDTAANNVEVGSDDGLVFENTVSLNTSGGDLLSEVNAEFSEDLDWSSVGGAVDTSSNKAYISGLDTAEGVSGTHTLYVPKGVGDDAVGICPEVTSLAEVSDSCPGLTVKQESDSDVSLITDGGQEYWKVDNLDSTGGFSYEILADDDLDEADDDLSQTGEPVVPLFILGMLVTGLVFKRFKY